MTIPRIRFCISNIHSVMHNLILMVKFAVQTLTATSLFSLRWSFCIGAHSFHIKEFKTEKRN